MIKKYSFRALQKAINFALSLDEDTCNKLKNFAGKVIKIHIIPLDVNFYLTFSETEISLLPMYDGYVDTTIASNPMGLIKLSLLPASKVRSLFNDKVKITGNVILGQKVKELFDELNIDWESHLAYFTGDVIAYQIGSLFKRGKMFAAELSSSLLQNATDFMQEELRILPPAEAVKDFAMDVDHLVQEVDRLEAKLNYLLKTYENH